MSGFVACDKCGSKHVRIAYYRTKKRRRNDDGQDDVSEVGQN